MKSVIKKTFPLFIISFFLFIIASYIIFSNEKKQIEKNIKYELLTNSSNIKSYFLNAESLIYSLKYTIEDKLNLNCCTHPAYKTYTYEKGKNLTKIINFEGVRSMDLSVLTSINNPQNYSDEKIHEISAALHLKPIFNSAMELLPDLKWVYYTSNKDFIYLSPNYAYTNDENLLKQYDFAFWQEAIPRNNPSHKMVITDLYEDGVGKGLLTTLSMPIFKNDNFRGVVSIDLGLNILNNLLPKNNTLGEVYLIDEKNQIVASKSRFKLRERKSKVNKYDIEIEIIHKQLKLLYIINDTSLDKKALYNASGKITIILLLIILTFITSYLKVALTKVQYYANTDSLTNLLNRRAMKKEIDSLISASRRYNQDLSFLLIDIDFFKKINDTYGHQIGDDVLIKVSKLFKKNTRISDVIARYGGEEFLIALSNTDINKAFILAERIRESVQNIQIKKKDIYLTVSIGCIKLNENDNFSTILKRVDKLLYKAKKQGRNCTIKEEIEN